MRRGPRVFSSAALAVLATLSPSASAALVVPPNDAFDGATPISELPFEDEVDLTAATREPGEPACRDPQAKTVWYTFTPERDIGVRVTSQLRFEGALRPSHYANVFAGTSLDDLELVSCRPRDPVLLEAGRTYHIQFEAAVGANGPETFSMNAGGTLAGALVDDAGVGISGACGRVFPIGTLFKTADIVAVDGAWAVHGLDPGDYQVAFGCASHQGEWYDDVSTRAEATVFTITEGSVIDGIDAVLGRNARISGTVTDANGEPLGDQCVHATTPAGADRGFAVTETEGTYALYLSVSGPVILKFGCSYYGYSEEWYDDAPDAASATPLEIVVPAAVEGIDATLARRPPPANDLPGDAAVVTLDPSFEGHVDPRGADEAPEIPMSCWDARNTVWYRYTAPESGPVVIDAGTYTAYALYTPDLEELACNRQGFVFNAKPLSFRAAAGETYLLQVGVPFTWSPDRLDVFLGRPVGVAALALEAPVPCAFACPYWTNRVDPFEAACAPEPDAPPGSWDEADLTLPQEVDGRQVRGFVFTVDTAGDTDGFVCRTQADAGGKYYVASDVNPVGRMCDPAHLGCSEATHVQATGGQAYRLRIYNWSDASVPDVRVGYIVDP